jgi:RHS repeat-associated protein
LRFPGQYFDEETNNYYNYFRDYDPSTGRYLEPDPTGNNSDLNIYRYGLSNPTKYLDRNGLSPEGAGVAPDFSPCDYYRNKGKTCSYHKQAEGICRGNDWRVTGFVYSCNFGVSESQWNCIRRCLVAEDAKASNDMKCTTPPRDSLECTSEDNCVKRSCIDDYHRTCFEKCGVRPMCYPGQYPGAGFGIDHDNDDVW